LLAGLLRRMPNHHQLWIGKAHCGNRGGRKAPCVAGNQLGDHFALGHGAVRQHWLTRHIADGPDDAAHVAAVAENLRRFDFGPLTLDPVMIAKGGAALLTEDAITTLRNELLPLATVLTPNLPEAEVLIGQSVKTPAEFKLAAQILQKMGAQNIIIKGGHQTAEQQANDYILYADGSDEWLSTPRIETVRTHGTGDTISACITAELAKGTPLKQAIRISKAYIQAAIANPIAVGHGHGPTNHWAYREVEHD